METAVFILLVLCTQIPVFSGSKDEKGLLMSDPVQLENEIHQLKSLVSSLQAKQSNTSTNLAALDSELKATKSALSTANLKITTIDTELTATKSALSTANLKITTMDSELTATKSALSMANIQLKANSLDIATLKSKGKPNIMMPLYASTAPFTDKNELIPVPGLFLHLQTLTVHLPFCIIMLSGLALYKGL